MGKTKRNASRWMETRFKYNDPMCPDPEFSDRRYQEKVRNGCRSYHHIKINPLTMKSIEWPEWGNWAKNYAKRVARHQAKILLIHEILRQHRIDEAQDYSDMMWDMCDDYQDDMMGFDYSWSDEAYVYAKRRRLEDMQDDYEQREWWSTHDLYEDWDYQW